VPPDKVSKARWLAAQEQKKKGIESAEDMAEWLRVRRHTWASLLDLLNYVSLFSTSNSLVTEGYCVVIWLR